MATSYTKEVKPGNTGNTALTWDQANYTWDAITGTWDAPLAISATSFTKETKPTSSYTKETKP